MLHLAEASLHGGTAAKNVSGEALLAGGQQPHCTTSFDCALSRLRLPFRHSGWQAWHWVVLKCCPTRICEFSQAPPECKHFSRQVQYLKTPGRFSAPLLEPVCSAVGWVADTERTAAELEPPTFYRE